MKNKIPTPPGVIQRHTQTKQQPFFSPALRPNMGMSQTVQAKMESAFGSDFSSVRIHTDSQAAGSLRAHAFTQGNDIHFAPGQYQPESSKGQQLLGHELTHVLQQRSGAVKPTVQTKGVAINKEERLEREADTFGQMASEGLSIQHSYATGDTTPTATVQAKCEKCEEEGEKLAGVAQMKSAVIQLHSIDDCDRWKDRCDDGCRKLPNKTSEDRWKRRVCWGACMAEYALCLAGAKETLTFAAIVAAIVLAAADGPLPIGDAAAAALLISVGIFP